MLIIAMIDMIVDSLKYCQKEKQLRLDAWVIMNNHVHLIASAGQVTMLADIFAILENIPVNKLNRQLEKTHLKVEDSACYGCLKGPGKEIAITRIFSFSNRIIIHLSCTVMRCYNKSYCTFSKIQSGPLGYFVGLTFQHTKYYRMRRNSNKVKISFPIITAFLPAHLSIA